MDATDDPPPEKRIGDRERHAVDARLLQAYDDGVLTLAGYDERVARRWAAVATVAVLARVQIITCAARGDRDDDDDDG